VGVVLAGLALALVVLITSFSSHAEAFDSDLGGGVHWLVVAATVAVSAGVLALMMRLSTPQEEGFREVLPGAVLIAVLWQLLQMLGSVYVSSVIKDASEMNAIFAVVLGLVALLYIASVMAILGLETNAVLLTPFTDSVRLTDADRRVYREYAQAQRHKGFEQVHVTFDDETETGGRA
jgi:membrane protein